MDSFVVQAAQGSMDVASRVEIRRCWGVIPSWRLKLNAPEAGAIVVNA